MPYTAVTLSPSAKWPSTATEEFSFSTCLLHTLAWQIVAFVVLACHIILVSSAGILAFPVWIGFVALLFVRLPLAGYTVFLQILLYQNLFISFFSHNMESGSFQILQGTGFAIAAVLSVISAVRVMIGLEHQHQARIVAFWIFVALGVVAAYTALGAARSSPTSAIVYFRNTTAALLALLIGLDVGRFHSFRTVATGMGISVLFGLCIALFEILDPISFYRAIQAATFMQMKFPDSISYPFYGAADVLDFQARSFFNFGGHGGPQVNRFGGPNMHAISYGYVLAVAAVSAASLGSYGFVALLFVSLIFAGVKGALIMLVAGILLQGVWALTRTGWLVIGSFVVFCVLYWSLGIIQGLSHGDYHVVGFLGGVHGFLENPLGHGIGVGGNLSAAKGADFDWREAQNFGANFGLESAIGVLLYQMGVGGAAVIWVYCQVLRYGWWQQSVRAGSPRSLDLVFAAMAVLLANGVFQEEAFSPYAMGLIAALCGVATTHGARVTKRAASAPDQTRGLTQERWIAGGMRASDADMRAWATDRR